MLTAIFVLSILVLLSYLCTFASRKSYAANLFLAGVFVLGFALAIVGIITFAILI